MQAAGESIVGRLSRQLFWQTVIGLGVLCAGIYLATAMLLAAESRERLERRAGFVQTLLRAGAAQGGEAGAVHKLAYYAPRRPDSFLELWRADGSLFYRDGAENPRPAAHWESLDFVETLPELTLHGRFAADRSHDANLLAGLAITLLASTLAGAAFVGYGTRWRVRRGLQPLQALAQQTRAIEPGRLEQRLRLDPPVAELQPWLEQFNGLMDRLQGAYEQLEGFNADVAHELRTPLATLIGQTELALSRERDADVLRDTLASNLEELQRLSALVKDMLFLAQAERGVTARRGAPASLAALARQVLEFHEGELAEAGLAVQVEGDALAAVDEPLLKRALSNLVGNAIRFADPGSTLCVRIDAEASGQALRVQVYNRGPAIAPQHLARLFDRFFRADAARPDSHAHHGLGLAIVAAIARMHAGRPLAESGAEGTRIGFTLAAQ